MSLKVQSAKLFALPIKPKVPWTELFTGYIKHRLRCARLFHESMLLEVVSIELLVDRAKLKAQSTELFLELAALCETSISYRARSAAL
jgi:hypothetical protein